MKWTVETLNSTIDAELDQLPPDMRARFIRISRLIEEFGLERVREPHIKHLQGPTLGDARHRPRRHFPRPLRYRYRPPLLLSFPCSLRKLKKLLSRRLTLRCDAQRRCRNE
jgi:hypothetical protein